MNKLVENTMERLKVFGRELLFVIIVTALLILVPVSAKTLGEAQVEGAQDAAKQQYENSKTTLFAGASSINFAAIDRVAVYDMVFGGVGAKLFSSNTPTEAILEQPSDGIATLMFKSAYNNFSNVPSQNIAGFYANMLLPKELNQKTQSVYAATECTEPGDINGILTRPPACKSAYDYWQDFGLGKLWSIAFVFAMAIVIAVLIVSGFMIMFRQKVGGQQMVTITMALQNILIGTVLALASFALGSFFVNLAKFLTLIVSDLFIQVLWKNIASTGNVSWWDPTTWWESITGSATNYVVGNFVGSTYISNPIGIFVKFIALSFFGDLSALSQQMGQGLMGGFQFPSGLSAIITKLFFFGQQDTPIGQMIVKAPLYIIGRIIAGGILFWYSVKTWAATLTVFLSMAFDTVTAPIIFVIGSFPGSKMISNWFKKMLKAAITIPLMFAVVNLAGYIIIFFAVNGGDGNSVMNPLEAISGGYYGATGGVNVNSVSTEFAGILFAGIGPAFLLMLLILSFAPRIPAFMDELIPTTGSKTMTKGLQSFGNQMAGVGTALWAGGLFKGTANAAKSSWTGK